MTVLLFPLPLPCPCPFPYSLLASVRLPPPSPNPLLSHTPALSTRHARRAHTLMAERARGFLLRAAALGVCLLSNPPPLYPSSSHVARARCPDFKTRLFQSPDCVKRKKKKKKGKRRYETNKQKQEWWKGTTAAFFFGGLYFLYQNPPPSPFFLPSLLPPFPFFTISIHLYFAFVPLYKKKLPSPSK